MEEWGGDTSGKCKKQLSWMYLNPMIGFQKTDVWKYTGWKRESLKVECARERAKLRVRKEDESEVTGK